MNKKLTPLAEIHRRLTTADPDTYQERPIAAIPGGLRRDPHPAQRGFSGETKAPPGEWLRGVVARFQTAGLHKSRAGRPTVEAPVVQPQPASSDGQLGEYVSPKKPAPGPFEHHPKATGPSTRRPTVAIPTLKAEGLTKARNKPVDPHQRIRDLLALAGNNPNPHEASSARNLAHMMMLQYPEHYPGGKTPSLKRPVSAATQARWDRDREWTDAQPSRNDARDRAQTKRREAAAGEAASRAARAAAGPGGVIGHTRSGKPVYQNLSPRDYKDFRAADHHDASRIHYEHPRTVPNVSREDEDHHYKMSDQHGDMAQRYRMGDRD